MVRPYHEVLLAGVAQAGAGLQQQAARHGLHDAAQRLARRQRAARRLHHARHQQLHRLHQGGNYLSWFDLSHQNRAVTIFLILFLVK